MYVRILVLMMVTSPVEKIIINIEYMKTNTTLWNQRMHGTRRTPLVQKFGKEFGYTCV